MVSFPSHVNWITDTGANLTSADGKNTEVWELNHQPDEQTLNEWASHFRNHYCLDSEIDVLRHGTPYSRADYLIEIKFPDVRTTPGPSIRSGDFAEVLIADYLEYLRGYWVPRTRYGNKAVRNESTKGSDILGFKIARAGAVSGSDILAIFESKARLSSKKNKPRLQDAVNDSAKDVIRKAESLNAIKQRLCDKGRPGIDTIERFQNEVDHPYQEIYGAAAIIDSQYFDSDLESTTDTSNHPFQDKLALIIIRGDHLMTLVHELYRRAADEA